MKISVDDDQCGATAQCFAVDEELFPLDGDGYSAVGEGREVPAGKEGLAQVGVDACPMAALYVNED
ncbi:MAG: ferredoxin [Actinophytocola sp.]|nr:ferredoxin [Actinophytocola sp.]